MIYGDIAEKKKVHEAFHKRLGDRYKIKKLGSWDCALKKFPIINNQKIYCALPDELNILLDSGFSYDQTKNKCLKCSHKDYIRFADFEIAEGRAYYERKNSADFIASRKYRLYDQMNKMDTFIQDGRKGLILEGMPPNEEKRKGFFSGFDKQTHDLRGLSPLEQAIEIGGGEENRNWTLSFIRECKMRGFEVIQTWDLEETITFLEQFDKGYDHEPSLRLLPKRYPEFSIAQNMLALVTGIGKKRSADLLKEYKTIVNLISILRKMPKKELDKSDILKQLYGAFFNEQKIQG